jgi:hypothetical protein
LSISISIIDTDCSHILVKREAAVKKWAGGEMLFSSPWVVLPFQMSVSWSGIKVQCPIHEGNDKIPPQQHEHMNMEDSIETNRPLSGQGEASLQEQNKYFFFRRNSSTQTLRRKG